MEFDEIKQCEELMQDLATRIQKEEDYDKKLKMIDTWKELAKQLNEMNRADRDFMNKSDEDADKERDYQLKIEQLKVQRNLGIAGTAATLLLGVTTLGAQMFMFHKGLKFEQDGTVRSFFVKNAANLNRLGKI